MKTKGLFIVSLVVAALLVGFGLYAANLVSPGTELPTHWNAHGKVDGMMAAPTALLLPPGLLLFCATIFAVIPRIEPLQDRLEASASILRVGWIGVIAMMILIEAQIAAPIFGWRLPVALPYFGAGLLFVLMGNVLPKSRPGFFVGIRTPWTLTDTDNWIATHRVAGKLMMIGGLAVVVLSLLPLPMPLLSVVSIAILAGSALVPVIYSWWFWYRRRSNA